MEAHDDVPWLEEGETVLWTGRPSLGAAVLRLLALAVLELGALYLGVRYFASAETRAQLIDQLRRVGGDQTLFLYVAGLAALIAFLAIRKWAGEHYAITDRRLVAWQRKGRISWSLPPDLVVRVSRGRLLWATDVRFNVTVRRGSSSSRNRPNVFGCRWDAGRVVERVEAWMEERQMEVLESVRDREPVVSPSGYFGLEVPADWQRRTYRLEDPADASLLSPMADDPVAIDGGQAPEVTIPDPSDSAETTGGWNTLVLLGPWHTALSVETYPGRPRVAPEIDGDSWQARLARLAGASPLEREEAALGGLSGERVRLRLSGVRQSGPRRHRASFLMDQWTLQGEGRWYRIVAVWSEVLPQVETALREVVETLELYPGTEAIPTRSASTQASR